MMKVPLNFPPHTRLLLALATFLAVLWLLFAGGPVVGEAEPVTARPVESGPQPLRPEKVHKKASREVARQLQYYHYAPITLNQEVSSSIFDNYMKVLDPQRSHFTLMDIREFEAMRHQLHLVVQEGKLEPVFDIYNRYVDRNRERLQYNLDRIAQGLDKLDLNTPDQLELDRENSPWPRDVKALEQLWEQRLKNAVLSQKLDDKALPEIADTLHSRFSNQLKRLDQIAAEDVFQTWLNAVTTTFDPHTQYQSPRVSENFNMAMSLSLEGIGAVLQVDNEFTKVVRLVAGGPADRHGGLKPGDRIVGVGQGESGEIIDVTGWRLENVVDLIRGPGKSTVRIAIVPAASKDEAKSRVLTIVREKVKLEDQAAKRDIVEVARGARTFRVGVVYIPAFYADFAALQAGDADARSTTRDVRMHIEALKEQGIDGLVIDLRNNGGGSLDEAISLTGLFIEEGPAVQVRYADDRVSVHGDPDSDILYRGPLGVLVNRMSASASEIFAGAVQDYGRGIVVGAQTFGKGTVQSVRDLSHGRLKITAAKFYRISGESTQHRGVVPDIVLPSVIDTTEVGEDALPAAMPWDKIKPTSYPSRSWSDRELDLLREKHLARMKHNEEYQLLLREIEYADDLRKIETVPLQESARRKEESDSQARELELVNARRKIDGDALFESWGAYEQWQEDRLSDTDSPDIVDFLARESAQILIDIVVEETDVARYVKPD